MKDVETNDIWITKKIYDDAESRYFESLSKASLTPLAEEVAKARQKLIESRDAFSNDVEYDDGAVKFFERKIVQFEKSINQILTQLKDLDLRISAIEKQSSSGVAAQPACNINVKRHPQVQQQTQTQQPKNQGNDDDDDVDLFASDSEEDEEAAKVREARLAAYAAKKSKKPVLIAKSNVILDIKPWDDETDMKLMEENVRKIEADGLLWGAAKLVPLAYGIHKLQISCVVEDDKVSIDWLTEQLEAIEEYVQSVDIAAFNKI